MENNQIADQFLLLSRLMDIHGENSFKSKTYSSASFNIDKLEIQLKDVPKENIFKLKGIGESTGKKIIELIETGELSALKELLSNTPAGVVEMLNLKGIGPKKISVIWKDMGVESIGELLYACKENRLKLYKGFGEKTQQNVIEIIEYYLSNQGSFLYAGVEAVESQITAYLKKIFSPLRVLITGSFARHLEVIEELEYVIECSKNEIKQKLQSANPPELLEENDESLLYKLHNGLHIRLYFGTGDILKKLFIHNGSPAFIEAFISLFPAIDFSEKVSDDAIIFEKANISYIPPYLREKENILGTAASGPLPEIIQTADIKGIIHSHSNWSDGNNTLEEMAMAAKEQGYEYLVISDHSKSAFYANGLHEDKIKAQHQLIEELNRSISGFKILKSIESDILYDGNLDYSDSILSTFDLVIASVHSILKMTEDKAMQRLITAIENPYTTILGHMTGRLLLSRKGYPVDHKKIIDACAANQVVIELNANPSRLDIDWRHLDYALNKNVWISINPDAHTIEGFNDNRFGVLAAQKGMLGKHQNLSSLSLGEFEAFIEKRKQAKGIA